MPQYIVRYGMLRSIGVMLSKNEESYRRGNEVVVRSDRGVEIGQVLCEATQDALSHLDSPPSGVILRSVSDDDTVAADGIDSDRSRKIEICRKHIKALGLAMKLIDVETLFGGERIIVYYLADERVDFRELVKLYASEFKTRIEMRQIGVRDEAKMLADYGDCGKPVCCNNHLITMPPVSMKMAKLQKATLDPTKISGRCGRLKCCLRYEFDTYQEIQKQLPNVGAHIVTANGRAKVLSHQIIQEQLLIQTEDMRRMVIDASEVLSVIKKSNSRQEFKRNKRKENRSPKLPKEEATASPSESTDEENDSVGLSSKKSPQRSRKKSPKKKRSNEKQHNHDSPEDEN